LRGSKILKKLFGIKTNKENKSTNQDKEDVIKKMGVPINVFERQPKDVSKPIKLDSIDDEIVPIILSFVVDTNTGKGISPLIRCANISKKWYEICTKDLYWRPILARFQLENPSFFGDLKKKPKNAYFEC